MAAYKVIGYKMANYKVTGCKTTGYKITDTPAIFCKFF
jgi:hypothetical protein